MRRDETNETFKLRLLALVLALALIWYSLNPAPRPLYRLKQKDEPPDEKKRNLEPQSMPATLPVVLRPIVEMAEPLLPSNKEEEDFEWPEFIDG